MPIYENILKKLNSKDITLDRSQLDFIDIFNKHKPKKSRLFFTLSKNIIKGFYLWGEVGRGKTLLLNSIYDELKLKKAKFHYIDFMQLIHKDLKALSGKKNPLDIIADSIVSDFEVIFIDEFQVEDVADAMIIGNLLNQLIQLDVILYITSNAHPNDLYKDGLQRQKFIDAIKILQKKLNVHKLDGIIDYRTRNIVNLNQGNPNRIFDDKDILLFIKANFENKNFAIIDKGRNVEENSFVLVENGLFIGLGYFNLNFQINNLKVLKKIIISMEHNKDSQQIIQSFLRKSKGIKILNY